MYTTRHLVGMDGVWLHELDDRIIIQGIEEANGKDTITAVSVGGRYGQRVTRARRDSLDLTVKFGLLIRKNDLQARSELLETVNGWAGIARDGAWLGVNYRPNRRLRVRLAQAPGAGNLVEWTKTYQIVLRAYEAPYWEENTPGGSVTTGTATTAGGTLTVGGNMVTAAECMIENMSGADVQRVQITIGGQQMIFSSLGMQGGEALVIDHREEDGLFRARIRGTGGAYRSVLAKRTGADDFWVAPGSRYATFTASRACRMTATARGRFL